MVAPDKGLVLERSGSTYRVATAAGEMTAALRGKLKHEDKRRVVVGDQVLLEAGRVRQQVIK